VPHTSDPYSAQYAPLVLAASARQQRNLVIFAVADYDYRELAENWALSNKKAGNPALLYALDSEGYQYLSSRGVPVFDGTANFKEWDGYRLVRHLQRVEAEKFTAAAALAASGLDVLLTDVSHVFRAQVLPALRTHTHGIDMAVARGPCTGKAPIGCSLWWNFFFMRGSAPAPRLARLLSYQQQAIQKGMVDFYLRWWNGHHCMFQGYAKLFDSSSPFLENTTAVRLASEPEANAMVSLRNPSWCEDKAMAPGSCLRIGLLPITLFPPQAAGLFQANNATALVGRAARPDRGNRLRLDRYDEIDFDAQRTKMEEEGLWLLGGS